MSKRIISPETLQLVRRARRDLAIGRDFDRAQLEPQRFGIGAPRQAHVGRRMGRDCGTSMPEIPGCEDPDPERYCDMQKVGAIVQIEGGTEFELEIQPRKMPYFKPKAVRAVVTDANNADLNHRVFITGVAINDFPQELFHEASPTVNTLDGIWSDDWIDPDRYAVKVPWGFMSNEANNLLLKIFGFARGYGSGTTLELQVTIYGQGYRQLPDWVDEACCHHPTFNPGAQAAA